MKTRMTILLLPFWVGCAGPAAAQNAQSPKPFFAITMNAPRTSVKMGTRIPLIVMMTNISDHDIPLGGEGIYGLPKEVVRTVGIMVYDSDGKRVPETKYGRLVYGLQVGGGPGICCSQWKPGESFIEESDLNKEFDLSKPGKYTAEGVRYDEGIKGLVMSNRISFTVIADDSDAQPLKASFSTSITTSGTSFRVGSPIPVTATMTNTSSHNVPIRWEFNRELGKVVPRRLIIQVLDSYYRPVPETEYGRNVHVDVASTDVHGLLAAILKPGESYKEDADLSREFVLTTPGTYTVVVQKRDPDTGERVRSNGITFTVTQ